MRTTSPTHIGIYAGVTVLVISSTFLCIREDLVSFLGFLEALFCLGIVRVAVRMIFHCQLAVSLLDLIIRSIAVDTQDLIIVFFSCHLVSADKHRAHWAYRTQCALW